MKFSGSSISGLLSNEGDCVGSAIREIPHHADVVVAQGFGVDNTGIPLRMLAYLAPVIRLLYQLPKHVHAEFYIAVEGVLRANHHEFHAYQVRKRAQEMGHLVSQYMEAVHPTLSGRWKVLFDRQVESGSAHEQALQRLTMESQPILESDEAIRRFAQRRGDGASRYMAEHAVYMRDPILGFNGGEHLLVPGMCMNMSEVIMIGGPAEKVFYRFRKALESIIGVHQQWRSHQFFTKVGSPPTYHVQLGEPFWQQRNELPSSASELLRAIGAGVSSERGVNGAVVQDLMVLLADAGGADDFAAIISSYRKARDGKPIPEDQEQLLQRGWERIRSLP